MKKTIQISICSLVILFSFTFCKMPDPVTPAADINVVQGKTLKGQSGVEDELSMKNILQVALNSPDHTTLVTGVKTAGLTDVLTNAGPLTVFAPTNDAFAKLPAGTLDELLKPENKKKLAKIITFHAAPGNYAENNIRGVMGIGQATGDKVKVTVENGATYVNGAKVLGSVKASNGYVHVIDAVLLPPEK